MDWNITQTTLDEYREQRKKQKFRENISILKKINAIFSMWNQKKTGYGIKITLLTGEVTQGLCWHICVHTGNGERLMYFLEEYEDTKVIIRSYSVLIEDVADVQYLGESKTVRPLPLTDDPIPFHTCYTLNSCVA